MSRVRCLAVWCAASAALAVLTALVLPGLGGLDLAASFEELLVRLCEAVLLGCGAWGWLVTGVVCLDAARGRTAARRGVPTSVRRLVLAGCGLALVGGVATPAHADAPGHARDDRSSAAVVDGLPLPERATAAGHVGRLLARHALRGPGRAPYDGGSVVVRHGDTLWDLAASRLPVGAPAADVARAWRHLYALNRAVVGDDPDLIHPGQHLRLPRPSKETR